MRKQPFASLALGLMTSKSRKFFSLGLIGALLLILALPVSALTPTEVAKLLASDAASDDQFGISVSMDGDTALIGASQHTDGIIIPGRGGSAYVFAPNPIIVAIEALIATVVSLNLQQNIENALDVVIQILDEGNQNNDVAASNVLVAFIQMVDARRGKGLTDTQADELVDAAQAIIDALSI